MVAPSYFLACRIFEDAGLETRAVGEGSEGVDVDGLERMIREADEEGDSKVFDCVFYLFTALHC